MTTAYEGAPEGLLTVPQVMARLQLGRSAIYDLIRTRLEQDAA